MRSQHNIETQKIETELKGFEDYLKYGRKKNGKESTKKLSERTLRLYLKHVEEMLGQLGLQHSEKDIKDYYENYLLESPRDITNEPYSHNSLTNITVAINHWLRYKGMNLKLPYHHPKEIEPLTDSEMERLIAEPLKHNDLMYYALFLTLKETAQRESDVLGINIDDLDLSNLKIYMCIKKLGNIDHAAIISERLAKAIRMYIHKQRRTPVVSSNPLWISEKGKRLSHTQVWKNLKNYAVSAGIKKQCYSHLWRHSVITLAMERGVPTKTIMEMYKIKSVQTLARYSHPSEEHMRAEFNKVVNGYNPKNANEKQQKCTIEGDNDNRTAKLREKLEIEYVLGNIDKEQYEVGLQRIEDLEL